MARRWLVPAPPAAPAAAAADRGIGPGSRAGGWLPAPESASGLPVRGVAPCSGILGNGSWEGTAADRCPDGPGRRRRRQRSRGRRRPARCEPASDPGLQRAAKSSPADHLRVARVSRCVHLPSVPCGSMGRHGTSTSSRGVRPGETRAARQPGTLGARHPHVAGVVPLPRPPRRSARALIARVVDCLRREAAYGVQPPGPPAPPPTFLSSCAHPSVSSRHLARHPDDAA